MENNALTYFDEMPDECLVLLAKTNWKILEELCMLLTLDIELDKQEGLLN